MTYLSKTLTAAALLSLSGLTAAVELSIVPSAASVQQGDTISVDLVASDLGDFAAPSLGAFFAEILFDDALLDFVSASYGAYLGDPDDPDETGWVTSAEEGVVGLDEFSWLEASALDALQPERFTLATLTFGGQAPGAGVLAFGEVDLSDAAGNVLVPAALNTASIQVNSVAIPVPPSVALLLPFFLLLAGRSRR